ncbi:tetratricopeptide repeat-containing sensor histidine kinase [uncultured Roseivirga sp.]|uniref:sensor histidine kinase n=1 Tax=uncultured Roseivirga sp. TaxID=543088 RepID=UPI00258BF77A|nr:tetratricopeptide repeat-containing sensor histidine kinase [uncultured Roseivirga sp.]
MATSKDQVATELSKLELLLNTDPQLTREISEILLHKAQDLDNDLLENEAKLWLGASLSSIGKYDSSIIVLDSWSMHNGKERNINYVKRNFHKAVSHYYLGEYSTAVDLFLSTANAHELTEEPKFHGRYFRVLGEVYRAADNLNPALENLEKALGICEEAQDTIGVAATLNRLGVVYYQKEEHEIAEKLLLQSLDISQQAGLDGVAANNFNDLGELYYATKEYEKCLALYERALQMAQDESTRINTLNNIARLDWNLGRFSEAVNRAKEALALAEEMNILTYKVDATKIIADSYEDMGKYVDATHFYNIYINYLETLFEEEQTKQIVELETQYQTAQKEREIENLQLQQLAEKERQQLYLIGLIVVALFLLILLMLFVQIRRNNRKISLQNHKLEELNASKDKFFSIIAHDLRSPMIALQGVGQKLEYFIRKEKQEKILEMGGKIDRSIDQLNHLLNNLLHWAASQTQSVPYKPEHIDLGEIINENVELYKGLIESKGIKIEQSRNKAMVFADRNALSAIVRNLLSNAIKFSLEGGRITVCAEEQTMGTTLTIKDEGVGIEKVKLQSLFGNSTFSTFGSMGERGFGLGLKLTKEFVDLNKGTISVTSEPGKGTCFVLGFPSQAKGVERRLDTA